MDLTKRNSATTPYIVTYNVMIANTENRMEDIAEALRQSGVQVALLQGTMRTLWDTKRGYDVIDVGKYRCYSFGTVKEKHAGCMISVCRQTFEDNEAIRIWALVDPSVRGRLGVVRLKRTTFDVSLITAYVPPVDANGEVREVGHKVYKCLQDLIEHKSVIPGRSIPIIGLDANGHVGLEYRWESKVWVTGGSGVVGEAEAEKENQQGKLLREFCENSRLSIINSFHQAGKTYYSQASWAQARVDYLLVPSGVFADGKCGATKVNTKLGNQLQYIISKYRVDHFPVGMRINILLAYLEKSEKVRIDRDLLASTVKKGGPKGV
jgi:hypothetical protein